MFVHSPARNRLEMVVSGPGRSRFAPGRQRKVASRLFNHAYALDHSFPGRWEYLGELSQKGFRQFLPRQVDVLPCRANRYGRSCFPSDIPSPAIMLRLKTHCRGLSTKAQKGSSITRPVVKDVQVENGRPFQLADVAEEVQGRGLRRQDLQQN